MPWQRDTSAKALVSSCLVVGIWYLIIYSFTQLPWELEKMTPFKVKFTILFSFSSPSFRFLCASGSAIWLFFKLTVYFLLQLSLTSTVIGNYCLSSVCASLFLTVGIPGLAFTSRRLMYEFSHSHLKSIFFN